MPVIVQTAFNQISQSAGYKEDDVTVSLTVCGGSNGGGSEVLVVETLVFDEGQITCPTNGLNPQWGGLCHSLSGNAGRTVVVIREKNDEARTDSVP